MTQGSSGTLAPGDNSSRPFGEPGRDEGGERTITMVNTHETVASTGLDRDRDNRDPHDGAPGGRARPRPARARRGDRGA